MLSTAKIYAVVPTKDLDRARHFYSEKLGLEPVKEMPEGLRYECDGTIFTMYQTDAAGTAQNTAMGWQVDDLDAEMGDVRAKGVVFEEYDFPGLKTVNGVVEGPSGRAAWFKDSEGNILCLSEVAA